ERVGILHDPISRIATTTSTFYQWINVDGVAQLQSRPLNNDDALLTFDVELEEANFDLLLRTPSLGQTFGAIDVVASDQNGDPLPLVDISTLDSTQWTIDYSALTGVNEITIIVN